MRNRNGISTVSIRKIILNDQSKYTKIRFSGQSPADGSTVEVQGYNHKLRIWEYITDFDTIHMQDGHLCAGH